MRADHHHVRGGAGLGLGDDVARALVAHTGLELDRGGARRGPKSRAGGLRDADDRDLHIGLRTEGGTHFVAVLVVGDDQRDRAALSGDGLLGAERAFASVHQHDGTGDGQAVVVGCSAARGVLDTGGYQRARHPFGRGALGVFERLRGNVVTCDRQRRVVRERQTHFEIGRLHVETLVPQRVGHVIDAGVVAWCAEGAVAAVGVGDLLQLLQVRHHRIGGHPLLQRRGEVRGGRRRCGLRGGGRLCLL